jgi:hypothetical protein
MENKKNKTYLFLDDIRTPESAFNHTKFPLFLKEKWDIVRNFNEFTEYIITNGLPDIVSFDHDLAQVHYDPTTWVEGLKYDEETGLDCAKWLVEYCMNNNLPLPKYNVHSQNPVGKENIEKYLNNFNKNK